MELLQLKYFCDAAKTQNFSKTAKKFLVPPSDISQSIKRLEKELKNQLFIRSANKVQLSEEGSAFYKSVKSALDILEEAKNAISPTKAPETIKININITRRVVMSVIEKFRKKYPDIYFITTHKPVDKIDDYDIIVTDGDFQSSFIKEKAAQEELLLAYNKEHFAFGEKITAEKLKNCPFISMSSGTSIYESTKKICGSFGFVPHIALQSEDPFYIRKCIELGLGIAIVPELSWRGQFSNNTALKKIGDYKRNIYIYQKHSMNKYLKEFKSMLIEEFNT